MYELRKEKNNNKVVPNRIISLQFNFHLKPFKVWFGFLQIPKWRRTAQQQMTSSSPPLFKRHEVSYSLLDKGGGGELGSCLKPGEEWVDGVWTARGGGEEREAGKDPDSERAGFCTAMIWPPLADNT